MVHKQGKGMTGLKHSEKTKQKIWLHLKTPAEIWEICL